jgi:inorganic pyrophosphatase
MANLLQLPPYDAAGNLQIVVECPRGARSKINYDTAAQVFRFGRPLSLGVAYPYDWGFVPGTRAEDGDALDAMVYHDMATYPGVVISSKPIGVVRLVDKDPGSKWQRNDRLIAVPAGERRWDDATALEEQIRRELQEFFVVVTMMTGKKVRVEGWEGPKAAKALVAAAVKKYEGGGTK